ncbi:MAG: gas vesicle protein GvpO [Chloroflexota bacterium]
MSPQTLPTIVVRTTKLLADVTGLTPVEVTGVARADQGWRVTIELLEFAKIPPANDVIAEYEVLLDGEGDLLSFQRKRSRLRSETVDSEAV